MYKSGIDCVGLPESTYEIRDSSGRGKGLFASNPIKAGDFMMYYDGERVDEFEVLRRYGSDPNSDAAGYVMMVTDDEYIDASDPQACKFGRQGQPGGPASVCFITAEKGRSSEGCRICSILRVMKELTIVCCLT